MATIRDKWKQFWNWVDENTAKPDDPNYYLQSPEPSFDTVDPWTAGETSEAMKFQTDESLKQFTYLAAIWWDGQIVKAGLKGQHAKNPMVDPSVIITGVAALLAGVWFVVSIIKKVL